MICKNTYPRICIASTSGGGGKTLLSLGLCRLLTQKNLKIKPFKKGPDYIDAAWLAAAARYPATNLDPFFMDASNLENLFCASMGNRDMAIIEGNRGLYDGLNESGICSTSNLARALASPILLCIDCAKSTRTIAAILNGLINFERGLHFAGVILNQVGSERHATSLRAAIEANTSLKILGILPRLKKNPLPERHMGLASKGVELNERMESTLDTLANLVRENCEIDKILALAQECPPLENRRSGEHKIVQKKCTIGVVRDEALWFYYPENLAALEEAGANLVFLSLMDNCEKAASPWQNLDGLYLGGGFPEDFPDRISRSPCLEKIRKMADQGLPIYAECGGLIALCASLQKNEQTWPMANIFPCKAVWHPEPQGLGYVEARVSLDNPWHPSGSSIRGHEFHYSHCLWESAPQKCALELKRGVGISKDKKGLDGLVYKNVWASYTHIFAPAVPHWARNFVALACAFRNQTAKG